MWVTKQFVYVCIIYISKLILISCQELDHPRGPWQLAFKVVSGKWDQSATNHATFWGLFTSTDTYNTASPVPDQRDYTTSSDHYKSDIVQQWADGYLSVQAIKLSFFKDNKEKAFVVFDAIGKTKTTWFKCDNILYSSYTDLPDNSLPSECPGRNVYNGLSFTMMKISYQMAYCQQTTGWLVAADTDFGFTLCPGYMPADGTEPKPYFKFSSTGTIADLSTELENADSMAIFFQAWDLAFKGVEGIKPSVSGISNLTGLFMSSLTENDNSDMTVRNLQHTQSSTIFKSGVINIWDLYFIDTVKFSMLKSGVEHAYVVFDGINSDKTSWFSESNILYSSYGTSLNDAGLDVCSIEGDSYRNWQIQTLADDTGCSSSHQLGWMLIKEPRNNGTCSWDTSSIKKKPFFLYNTATTTASPALFQYADVMAVFVHGWRLVFKIPAGGSTSLTSSIHSLWTQSGALNEGMVNASLITSDTPFKSSIIDQWTSLYIRGVKIAAYKNDMEVFNAVFDATGSTNVDWFDCNRLLYTSVTGLTRTTATSQGYTCSIQGESSTFRFLIGKDSDCSSVSATGVFSVIDADSTCSSRSDLPLFIYSNTLDTTLADTSAVQLADTFAVFVDMANCYSDTCLNGATCQDIGGNYRCFCTGSYYGNTCANLDGTYGSWGTWSTCSVSCGEGTQSRSRPCSGTEGDGVCIGESEEFKICTLDPCPIDGGYSEWTTWSQCTVTCGTGSTTRSRDCTNPVPQYGGSDCVDPSMESENCNTHLCPIDGGLTDWSEWSSCSVSCDIGTQSRERTCSDPAPKHGGADCDEELSEVVSCDLGPCPVHGGYTEWGEWTICSLTCGSGEQTRSRECTNPVPQFGGNPCVGVDLETQTCNTNDCPIDGGYTEWGEWTICSLTCGSGEQTRSRECTNPVPQFGGNPCGGVDLETQPCNTNDCPIDGGYTEWGEWTICSLTCGSGERTRSRECTNPVPQFGGNPCVGVDLETQTCNTNDCPIDGGYTEWGEWTICSLTCGSGEQTRSRECTNPVPQFGGNPCVGVDLETQTCNTNDCPIDGGYTEWGEWTICSLTCGSGEQTRSRECTNPVPQFGGNPCVGVDLETQTCNTNDCPIDGGYTEWGEWTICSLTCGSGEQTRLRECTNPVPQFGGNHCGDVDLETQTCNTNDCPIDGGYTEWGEWTICSLTCGNGAQTRSRECTSPVPQFGGNSCVGVDLETQTCNTNECPIDGGYTEWGEWTICSLTCGSGEQTRSRECTNPVPQFGGDPCVGVDLETQTCNTNDCPIDGGYTEWGEWAICSLTCGSGEQTRSRECTNPVPQFGGNPCVGVDLETQTCNTNDCPIDGGYTEWEEWTICSLTCGSGEQTRSRECTNPVPQFGGYPCGDVHLETQTCNTNDCPINGGYTEWGEWTICSMTCGSGEQTRSRECTNPVPQFGGNHCGDVDLETQTCNTNDCPIDGGYTEWGEWTICSLTCGNGAQTRSRECTSPVPQFGGNPCVGVDLETQTCNTNECPIDGGYTEWGEWTICSLTCGSGEQTRSRECTNPVPQFGGNPCVGVDLETQTCNTNDCRIDGGYTEWGEWTICSLTCGSGEQTRSRECTNPVPQFGGNPCGGVDLETQTCNINDCPIDGGYTEWGEWTICSLTCGSGEQTRLRECTNPVPQFGGNPCVGVDLDTQTCNTNDCPIDGGYTEWGEWTICSLTCGSGEQTRSRECINPVPQFGGNPCGGVDLETQTCNTNDCPIDGGYTEWGEWTICSLTYGNGEQTRSRECTNPVPQFGGNPCVGVDLETQTCNTNDCPIDGGYTEWGEWTICSLTCGSGEQTRSRECTNPVPQFGGNPYEGVDLETQTCNTNDCPIDGGYTEWGEWTICSLTCGSGEQTRSRECTNPVPQFGGNTCGGVDLETQTCNTNDCHIDGGYTEWGEWTICSLTCGSGEQTRSRECTNPVPQFGGNLCGGVDLETQTCNTNYCPIDGGYTEWGEWTICSLTCGSGERTRSRECTNPVPQFGGNPCVGVDLETQTCNTNDCPIDGGYTKWGEWTICSLTCESGEQTRSRECTNPVPQLGGNPCVGVDLETQTCNTNDCPIDGGYTEWGEWTICSLTCGSGEQTRSRECTNPVPQFGGNPCGDVDLETQACNTNDCPIDGGYTEWGEWTICSLTCGSGDQTRSRECTSPVPQFGGNPCEGVGKETQTCNTNNCPIDGGYTEWGEWSICSVTCGSGEQTRSRECTNPVPDFGGMICIGSNTDIQICYASNCAVDGGFSIWTTWSDCTSSCGSGLQTRSRKCDNPLPQNDGADCVGDRNEQRECLINICPVDGGFSPWSVWSTCTLTCGGGEMSRSRDCNDPTPAHGGALCVGDTTEIMGCNVDDCPVNGGYTEWGSWSECSLTCGEGVQTRSRDCSNPAPQFGGDDCIGDDTENQTCDQGPCPVDGYLTEWEEWGQCTVSCGEGTRVRDRTCVEPLNGGAPCDGAQQQTELCNSQECPIDGFWSEWNDWSECTKTCEHGTRERSRTCTEPQNGGQTCPGAKQEVEFCNKDPCPVDGVWLGWSEWSDCSKVCGSGTRNRSRTCVEPQNGGVECEGEHEEIESCNEDPCPVDGYWMDWSVWSQCSVSCSDGIRNRTRSCVQPLYGGADCVGNDSFQTEACNHGNCPIDGYWSDWSDWTSCTMTCGGGSRNKTRSCTEPQYGGHACDGEVSETDTCNIDPCPIDGEWSDWSSWSVCTNTCGGGTRNISRTCSVPKYGGKYCDGVEAVTDMCNTEPCPVDGYWDEWSTWTECTVSCQGGSRDRFRTCVEPKFGGGPCLGNVSETEECNTQMCPVDGQWTSWTQWSQCSSSCSGGAQNRSRTCIPPMFGGKQCEGHDIDIQICGIEPCPSIDGGWSTWSSWTGCSMTCGLAERLRNRTCTDPAPQWGGKYCEGVHIQSETCKENDCPVDGIWTEWSSWSSCFNMTVNNVTNLKCGHGFKHRNRSCDNPAPQLGGESCSGETAEISRCNVPCHRVTCSKEHPERCQIIFNDIPGNKGTMVTVTSTYFIVISFIYCIRIALRY